MTTSETKSGKYCLFSQNMKKQTWVNTYYTSAGLSDPLFLDPSMFLFSEYFWVYVCI